MIIKKQRSNLSQKFIKLFSRLCEHFIGKKLGRLTFLFFLKCLLQKCHNFQRLFKQFDIKEYKLKVIETFSFNKY